MPTTVIKDAEWVIAWDESAKRHVYRRGVDITVAWDGWAELLARSGLRAYLAPGFASARWKLENDWDLKYAWDEARGRAQFEAALRLVDEVKRHNSGRLSGMISPMQIDTC